jgi:hypothetical protein
MTLVGSPCFAQREPTSLYLTAAHKAVKQNSHRKAIYCLCMVLRDVLEKTSSSKGLNLKQLLLELESELNRAGLSNKAIELGALKSAQIPEFIQRELDASDPAKTITVFSDGSFYVNRTQWDDPCPPRPEFTRCRTTWSNVVLKSSSEYQAELKKYWWFRMPSAEELAKLPKYVPPSQTTSTGPDGAFK